MSATMNYIDWSKWDSTQDCFVKYRRITSNLIYGTLPDKKPDVSIMIPTFRRADLLKEAIDSALVQKTQYTFNITVVDNDAEKDYATDELLRQYCSKHNNILYYRNEKNIGMFGNWNRCIELAQAEWMIMLHDDDMLKESFVETMLAIAKRKRYGILCCTSSYLDERDIDKKLSETTGFGPFVAFLERLFIRMRGMREIQMREKDPLHGRVIFSPAHLVKTSDAISSGGYNDEYFPISDIVFCQKMIKYYTGAYVAQQLYFYRLLKNESFNLETIYNSIRKPAEWLRIVHMQQKRSDLQCEKIYWEEIIYRYCNYLDYKDIISLEDLKHKFNIPKRYQNRFMQSYVVSKRVLSWGLLFFRVR